jgi:hypothetical protein
MSLSQHQKNDLTQALILKERLAYIETVLREGYLFNYYLVGGHVLGFRTLNIFEYNACQSDMDILLPAKYPFLTERDKIQKRILLEYMLFKKSFVSLDSRTILDFDIGDELQKLPMAFVRAIMQDVLSRESQISYICEAIPHYIVLSLNLLETNGGVAYNAPSFTGIAGSDKLPISDIQKLWLYHTNLYKQRNIARQAKASLSFIPGMLSKDAPDRMVQSIIESAENEVRDAKEFFTKTSSKPQYYLNKHDIHTFEGLVKTLEDAKAGRKDAHDIVMDMYNS